MSLIILGLDTPSDLQLLQSFTKEFVNAITSSTRRMPYGMRCIARDTLQALRVRFNPPPSQANDKHFILQKKFPDLPDEDHAIALGQLIYYRFLNPAVM